MVLNWHVGNWKNMSSNLVPKFCESHLWPDGYGEGGVWGAFECYLDHGHEGMHMTHGRGSPFIIIQPHASYWAVAWELTEVEVESACSPEGTCDSYLDLMLDDYNSEPYCIIHCGLERGHERRHQRLGITRSVGRKLFTWVASWDDGMERK